MPNGDEIPGDIPVIGTKASGAGADETFTIRCGPNGPTLKVRTQNKPLQITVKSGDKSFTLPLEKNDWELKIDEAS